MAELKTLADLYRAAGAHEWPDFAEKVGLNPEFQPYSHQVLTLNKALINPRWGDYGEPGTGKTFPAQAWAAYLIGYGNKVVGVMPPTLVEQFMESLPTNFPGIEEHVRVTTIPEGPKAREVCYERWEQEGWPDLLLLSYQLFLKEHLHLIEAGYRVLLADESHLLKDVNSLTRKATDRFLGCSIADTALLSMTGTPSTNTLMDLYGMISLVSPEIYPNQRSFERQHCNFVMQTVPRPSKKFGPRGFKRVKKLVGFRNHDLMNKNLYHRGSRVLRDQVFRIDKPVVQRVPVTLGKTHHDLYRRLVRQRFLEVDGKLIDATTAQSLRMKSLRIATCPHLFSDAGKAPPNKVFDAVETLLDTIDNRYTDKAVLFCHFRETVEALAERFKGRNPAVLYGGTAGGAEKQKQKFIKDESCRLFIANTVSGGVGIDGLQKVCRYAIFVEPTGVPGQFKQAVDRLVRGGQKHVVTVYILDLKGTVSLTLTSNMLRKEGEILEVTCDATSLLDELLGRQAA